MESGFESELVIGLVSAIGTENKQVIDLLTERLNRAGYEVKTIKISRDVIPLLGAVSDQLDKQFARSSSLMDAGNKARSQTNDDSILALGAAAHIFAQRPKGKEKGVVS
jgi:hypothetical protein